MQRSCLFAAVPLALAATTLAAAQATTTPTLLREYSGVHQHISGIFVAPVPGAPFSATVQIVSHEKLPNAAENVLTTHNAIARSSSGRVYNERRRLVRTNSTEEPQLISAHIYDPDARQNIFLLPHLHLAREMTLRTPEHNPALTLHRVPGAAFPHLREGETETSLGTKVMNGLELTGTRRERTIPASFSSTGKPLVIVDELWYSADLGINMVIRHNDPRTGEQIVAVTDVNRAEPPAERFAIPAGYKVVDETPEVTTQELPASTQ